ncbi:hypothetical protein ACOMCU_22560 [Lysinibacillus sp. UGB7]|uniref:hypothetical protein n=1 Tax=Lysinibacillus sp. UGB7 TaxID=3411039 RepID=UPI003B78178B
MIDMTSSQAGQGDRETIGRLMSRLTMAKVLNLMGHDTTNFIFSKNEYNEYSYYPIDVAISDIKEFLDTIDANYLWDEEESILTLNFASEVKNIGALANSISFGWSELEFSGDDELEDVIEYIDNGLRFNLVGYEGIPLMFFRAYYELLKENNFL